MKIILSRKGFDSANGGVASPILPSGELCSLPIPGAPGIPYHNVQFNGASLGQYVNRLTNGKCRWSNHCHLDPDLNRDSFDRALGWRPLFGQVEAAQTHLANKGVGKGDVFVFYGWFRQARQTRNGLTYEPHAPDLHVIFGWLQIDKTWSDADGLRIPEWAQYHSHLTSLPLEDNDTVYVASKTLQLGTNSLQIPGAGIVKGYREELCLTAPGRTRSNWKLPAWFNPRGRPSRLSYHEDLKRWRAGKDCVYLKSVPIGQEFVLDCDDYPESIEWLSEILGASV